MLNFKTQLSMDSNFVYFPILYTSVYLGQIHGINQEVSYTFFFKWQIFPMVFGVFSSFNLKLVFDRKLIENQKVCSSRSLIKLYKLNAQLYACKIL